MKSIELPVLFPLPEEAYEDSMEFDETPTMTTFYLSEHTELAINSNENRSTLRIMPDVVYYIDLQYDVLRTYLDGVLVGKR